MARWARAKAFNEPYSLFYPWSDLNQQPEWLDETIQIVSIDPGLVNFSIRVESRPWRSRGPIKPLLFTNIRLKDCPYHSVTTFLNQHRDLLRASHVVIVERQLPDNYKAVRISQHVLSYFLLNLWDQPQRPLIVEISPKLKNRRLGAPKCKYHQLKRWTVERVKGLLNEIGDYESLKLIQASKKKDDLCDTFAQIEALCMELGWPTVESLTTFVLADPSPHSVRSTDNN